MCPIFETTSEKFPPMIYNELGDNGRLFVAHINHKVNKIYQNLERTNKQKRNVKSNLMTYDILNDEMW